MNESNLQEVPGNIDDLQNNFSTQDVLLRFIELLNKLNVKLRNAANTSFKDVEDGFIFAQCLHKM
jgi:hypothetical protein